MTTESKSYYDAFPEHFKADTERTGELKKFSKEMETADRRQQVTLRASEEYNRRIKRCMLYTNRGYEDASRVIADQDKGLMQLYVFGEIIKE